VTVSPIPSGKEPSSGFAAKTAAASSAWCASAEATSYCTLSIEFHQVQLSLCFICEVSFPQPQALAHVGRADCLNQFHMPCLRWGLLPGQQPEIVCWCRRCRRTLMPGPYGWLWPADDVRFCCRDSWLARGWFCRWCGRDDHSGTELATWGVYGSRSSDIHVAPSWCECGWELQGWRYFNWASCGSCWTVCTRQLVHRLWELLDYWSEPHELIFAFLVDTPAYTLPQHEQKAACDWVLGQIRDMGRRFDFVPPVRTDNFQLLIPGEFPWMDDDPVPVLRVRRTRWRRGA